MCNKILLFIANLYPFNKKITRSTFLKLNFIFTIVIIVIFSSNLDSSSKLGIVYTMIALWSPVGIYQYMSEENPLYGVGNTFVCVTELLLLFAGLMHFVFP